MKGSKPELGFSLLELMIATALGTLVMLGAIALLRQGLQVNSLLGQRNEMQQNARVGINYISRDVSLAGTGLPLGGFQLPSGNSSVDPRFGCDDEGCYVGNNTYADDRLYSITPFDALGPLLNGASTDMVTLAYRDPESRLDESPLVFINTEGTQIQVHSDSAAETAKIKRGDVLALQNDRGSALGVVTAVSGDVILLGEGDPLRFNQPSAEFGNIASLADEGPPYGVYPPTEAYRVNVVSFFIDAANNRLMRQVNAHKAYSVAERVDDLQFTYDIMDPDLGGAVTGLSDAGGKPNQIRKANVSLRARAPRRAFLFDDYQRIALSTSISARNLTFRDRYQ